MTRATVWYDPPTGKAIAKFGNPQSRGAPTKFPDTASIPGAEIELRLFGWWVCYRGGKVLI